ncbi:MAG: hypothetical protein F6K26_07720 [Moorea sp. SIO2I5]|nr:hypothetical protein [Moorena sp. SIO2I5]
MNYSLYYSYEVHRIFYLLPLTCSLLPAPCSLKARTKVPHDYDNCYIPLLSLSEKACLFGVSEYRPGKR